MSDTKTAMRERPIPFSGPEVRAVLAGTKTQTRRVISEKLKHKLFDQGNVEVVHAGAHCPFGQAGDRLWVREAWGVGNWNDKDIAVMWKADGAAAWMNGAHPFASSEQIDNFAQRYGRPSWKNSWGKPSIHMPRWASRITLEITEVRVQRVQDINEADAVAEGVYRSCNCWGTGSGWYLSAKRAYQALWTTLHGPDSWAKNCWVWALTFRRITP